MPARRRRVSNSSVETVDDHQVHWRQESSVLKSTPKDQNQDYWPTYELRDTVVLNKDGQTLENALYVAVRGPFIIRGTLVIDAPGQRRNLLMRVRTSVPIEIRQSIKYCIGMSEDNQPQIWVSGKAGWYEINPAPAYQAIYNKMCEATLLYYGLMDGCIQHKPPKSKQAKRTVALKDLYKVFHEASVSIGDGVVLEELLERCEEHAPFLISQALEDDSRPGEEDKFQWASTPFYRWMTTKYQNVLKNAQERFLNPPKPPRSPSADLKTPSSTNILPSRTRTGSSVSAVASRSRARSSQETGTKAVATSPKRRSSRSHSISQKETGVSTPKPPAPKPQSPLPTHHVAIVTKAKGTTPIPRTKAPTPNPITTARETTPPTRPRSPPPLRRPEPTQPVASTADNEDAFQSVLSAVEWVYQEECAKKDGLAMSRVLNKLYFKYKFPNFRNGQVACHRIPAAEVLHYNAEALLRVLDKDKYGPHEFYSWLQEAVKREFQPIAITKWPYTLVYRGVRPTAPRANQLVPEQPSNSLPAGPKPGDGHITIDDGSSENSAESSGHIGKTVRRPGRRPGGKSGLRLATSSKKRPHSAIESDSGSEGPGPKRSHYFSDGGEAMDVSGDTSFTSEEDDQDQELIKIVIRADKMPSTTPKGPQETWICEETDCDYVVRGGDAEECQRRIHQHFQAHEAQVDRVNLALTESRGHLPINHLLDKIKKMGEKAEKKERISVNGIVLPPPIKRKLII